MNSENKKIAKQMILLAVIALAIVPTIGAAVYVPVIYVNSENKNYGWDVTNNIEGCCEKPHSNSMVLPPGPILSVVSPVNLIIDDGDETEFSGGLINLSIGYHELHVNGKRLMVEVVDSNEVSSREKETPGFSVTIVLIATTIAFGMRHGRQ